MLYSSDDGFSYTYLSTIASAADNPWSDEGPNEHAMEVLAATEAQRAPWGLGFEKPPEEEEEVADEEEG